MSALHRLAEATPHIISLATRRFIESAGCGDPSFIPVEPEEDARVGRPLRNVYHAVRRHGGFLRLGWLIRECPDLWHSAEFTGILLTPYGLPIDVTPKEKRYETTVLFVPDDRFDANFRLSDWPFTVRSRIDLSKDRSKEDGLAGLENAVDTYLSLLAEIDRTFVLTIEGRRCAAPARLSALSDLADASERRLLRMLDFDGRRA